MGAANKFSGNKITGIKVRPAQKSPKSCENEVKSETCLKKDFISKHLHIEYISRGVFISTALFLQTSFVLCIFF